MKNVLLNIVFIFVSILNINGQIAGIKVTQDNFDNYYSDLFITKSSGYLLPSRLDVLNKKDFEITEKFEINIPQIGFTYPFLVLEDTIQDNIRICGFSNENSKNNIVTCDYNTKTNSYSIINSTQLGQSLGPWYLTPPQYYDGAYYSILNLFSPTYNLLSITFLKISTLGDFKIIRTIDKNSASMLFFQRWINELQIINENRFLLAGDNQLLSIIDTLLNVKFIKAPKHPTEGAAFLKRPNLSNINNNILYLSDFYAVTFLQSDEIICKFNITHDSFNLIDYKIVSNTEKQDKYLPQITKTVNDIFYTTISPDFQLSSYKGDFPCNFYVTKFNGLNEVWHKAFGGDHYYRIFDIQMLDTCHVVVTGSVYDYYQNGNLQGFYALIDCNGKLLNFEYSTNEIGIRIYPTPIHYEVNLELLNRDKNIRDITIMDIQGKVIRHETKQEQTYKYKMDVSDLSAGLFLVKVKDQHGKTYSERMVKY